MVMPILAGIKDFDWPSWLAGVECRDDDDR